MGIRWTNEQVQEYMNKKAAQALKTVDPVGRPRSGGDRGTTGRYGAVTASSRGRSKYGNQPTMVDGVRFDSKAEAAYYRHLKVLKLEGELAAPYFLRQVPFHLPGGVIYRLDFMVFPFKLGSDGDPQFIDVKGFLTPTCKLKLKQVEDIYRIEVICVKKTKQGFTQFDWR